MISRQSVNICESFRHLKIVLFSKYVLQYGAIGKCNRSINAIINVIV